MTKKAKSYVKLDAILAKAREQAKGDPNDREKIAQLVRALITHPNPKPPNATL